MADDAGIPDEEMTLDLREIWEVIIRGRWYILVSFTVIVGITAFFTFTADPVYQSSAKIIKENKQMAQTELASLLQNPLASSSRNELQNSLEIIHSSPVLEGAKQRLANNQKFVQLRNKHLSSNSNFFQIFGFGQDTQVSGGSGSDIISVGELRSRLEARIIPDTDIIQIKATGSSPRVAQFITDAIVQSYKEVEIQNAREDITNIKKFLENQLTEIKERLQSEEKQVLKFQRKTGLVLGRSGLEQKLTKLEEMHADASVELQDKRDELNTISKMLSTVKKNLFGEDLLGPSGQRVTMEVQDKIAQLRKLQQDIQELEKKRTKYLNQGNYIKAQQLEEKIKQKNQKYEETASEKFKALELLPKYESLITKQLEAKVAVEAAENRVQILEQKIETEVQKLAEHGLELMRYNRNLDISKEIYTMIRKQYEQTRITEAGKLGQVRVISAAKSPSSPIKPNTKTNLMIAVVLGLAVGVGVAFVREYMDTRVRVPEDTEPLGLTSLGTVVNIEHNEKQPQVRQLQQTLITNYSPQSAVADSYATLEANLRFLSLDEELGSMAISSASPGEGKTTTTLNLGLTMAQMGKKTLIVDADLRNPIHHKIFELPSDKGLTNLVLNEQQLGEAIYRPYLREGLPVGRTLRELILNQDLMSASDFDKAKELFGNKDSSKVDYSTLKEALLEETSLREDDWDNLIESQQSDLEQFFVLPAGEMPPNPAAFFNSNQLDQQIAALEDEFEIILFDTPPITATPDTSIVSTKTDGVALVVAIEETDIRVLENAIQQLDKAGSTLLGGVFNKLKVKKTRYYGQYGYYGSGYGYGYGEKDKDQTG